MVRRCPTFARPLMLGSLLLVIVSSASATGSVGDESADLLVHPSLRAVTRTVTCRPAAAAPTLSVGWFAPTGLPSARHWYEYCTSVGFQVPGVAVNVLPTIAGPVIAGAVRF